MERVVVTRHKALVRYLYEQGLVDGSESVLVHACAADIKGKHVIGVLPLHLAAKAAKVTEIPLQIPSDLRGEELTLMQIKAFAGPARTYVVREID